jgi:hypothetical protein
VTPAVIHPDTTSFSTSVSDHVTNSGVTGKL